MMITGGGKNWQQRWSRIGRISMALVAVMATFGVDIGELKTVGALHHQRAFYEH